MGAIFVSYRRSDSQGEAGRLFDDLVMQFGDDKVFMDVAGIEVGRDFRKAIEEGIAKCGVLLVVMGPAWATATDEHGTRRLDDPQDFVRIEVASALTRDIPVIPVLVRGAQMPHADQLPDCLKDLAFRNCVELTHARWRSDIQLLLDPLRRLVGAPGEVQAVRPISGARPIQTHGSLHEASAVPGSEDSTAALIDPAAVQRITRELALHIGPIAEVVVKRAAHECTSAEDLCRKVAEEIDSPQGREKFLHTFASPRTLATTFSASKRAVTEPSRSSQIRVPMPVADASDSVTVATAGVARPVSRKNVLLIVVGAGLLLLLVMGRVFLSGNRTTPPGNQKTSQQQPNTTESAPGKQPVEAPVAGTSPKPPPVLDAIKNSESSATDAVAATPKQPPLRVRVPAGVSGGLLIRKVVPVYPPLARQARIQGAVVLQADISKEGTIENLELVSGHPMLVPAAIDAVKQWRYKPYKVNGEPVAVETQVTVDFSLVNP